MTQVLNILSQQQENSQYVNAINVPSKPSSDPPRPGRSQKDQTKSCWACRKQRHIARSCHIFGPILCP